jgi:ribonuclease J
MARNIGKRRIKASTKPKPHKKTKPYSEQDDLLFLPLGGSCEIGMNLNLYCTKGKWLMVDLGMAFAGDYYPGVDLLFPDPAFIEDRRDQLVGIVLTHGHEDHIGAIPYLWPLLGNVPLYATPFTAVLIRDKLAEHDMLDDVEIIELPVAGSAEIGPFKVTYMPLAHSIAEGNGLLIETDHGNIFHTGDWKLDKNPLVGNPTSAANLTKLGDDGVLCMVGDSTNVFNPNASGSEGDVRESLIKLVSDIEGRVIITTFASNIARLETIGEVARKTGRHLALLGRSMKRYVAAARATGYLKNFPIIMDEEDIGDIPRDKMLILCTGCQGESRAVMSRIAHGDHRFAWMAAGDTVIFSSKIIPGNEISIGRLVNQLVDEGIQVITEKDEFVHVSGHPGQPELADMYSWIRPQKAIPVHGEPRHLEKHKIFAKAQGVAEVHAPRNGEIIRIAPGRMEVVDEAPVGLLALDGTEVIYAGNEVLAERRRLMHHGCLNIALVLDEEGYLMTDPRLTALGIPGWTDTGKMSEVIMDIIEAVVETLAPRDLAKNSVVEEQIRIRSRKFLRETLNKNTQIDVTVLRLDAEE